MILLKGRKYKSKNDGNTSNFEQNDGFASIFLDFALICSNMLVFALLQNDGNTIHLCQEVKIMVDKKTLGKIIQGKRKELGKTQSKLAEETDLSRNYISDIENGRYTPSIDSLTKIAVSLGLDLNVIKMTEIQVVDE